VTKKCKQKNYTQNYLQFGFYLGEISFLQRLLRLLCGKVSNEARVTNILKNAWLIQGSASCGSEGVCGSLTALKCLSLSLWIRQKLEFKYAFDYDYY